MSKSLVCKFDKLNDTYEIKSPGVGHVDFFVEDRQMLIGGQVIGVFSRLNQRIILKLSDDCEGIIVWLKNRSKLVPTEFGETILKINLSVKKSTNVKANRTAIKIDTDERFIESPMDGMFYLSPAPSSPPFVKIGDEITPGQTVGLIEVMKCFYPLKYQEAQAAKVIDIKIKNAMPVNSGTKLYVIE